jgi:integrase
MTIRCSPLATASRSSTATPPAAASRTPPEKAGIEGVTFHSMRHAFASRMIDRGISSTVLAALMGHESSTITERRYIHLFDRQRTDEAVRQAMVF